MLVLVSVRGGDYSPFDRRLQLDKPLQNHEMGQKNSTDASTLKP